MRTLAFDPELPPARPPIDCGDVLLWQVAHALRAEHRLTLAGPACRCVEPWPCQLHRLAARGLRAAFARGDTTDARRARRLANRRWF